MRAAFNGHSDILGMLIAAGADVNVQSKSGWTALMYATARGNLKSVAILCEAGADPTLKTHADGKTAVDIADKLRADKGPATLRSSLVCFATSSTTSRSDGAYYRHHENKIVALFKMLSKITLLLVLLHMRAYTYFRNYTMTISLF